jgi:hypothetical protein
VPTKVGSRFPPVGDADYHKEMGKHLLVFCLIFWVGAASGKVLIATVAQVKNHVITSREVAIHQELDNVLGKKFKDYAVDTATEVVIREWLLYLEASSFYSSQLSKTRLQSILKKANERLSGSPEWSRLGVQPDELRKKIRRRIEADRLFAFKKKASVLPVSLTEIETEFSQNRVRYGNKSFEDVKEKIRQTKVEENLQSRMQQWFSVLERKYKVQRFSQFSEIK